MDYTIKSDQLLLSFFISNVYITSLNTTIKLRSQLMVKIMLNIIVKSND